MDDCVFCKIIAKQIPCTIVREDESTLAFMDIGSVNPGHVLVVCRVHVSDVLGLDERQAAAMFQAAALVAKAINRAYSPPGVSIYQANGAAAGQTVFHAHIHVVPRYEGDGMDLVWPAKHPPRAELERAADRIRGAL